MKKVFYILFLFTTFGVSAQSLDSAKLNEYLDLLETNDKAMLSVAIVENGQPIYQKSIGFADVEGKIKSNSQTQYRIGSITKVFTAAMIFQLIQEGKLSLSTKLSQFYSEIENADDITLSMLLSHRSGIHNFTNTPAYSRYMAQSKTKSEMLDIIKTMESDFEPGSRALYSNSGYILLGYILEDVTQDSYAAQLKERITDKLGLTRTSYGGPIEVSDNQAKSYQYHKETWTPATQTDMSIPHGAGAIISTPTDVAVFLTNLFEGNVVSKDSLAKMMEMNQGFGRGLFRFPFYDKQAFGHTGGIDGFSSQGAYFQSDDVAIVITSNGMNYPLNDVSIGILSLYFGVDFDFPDFSSRPISLPESALHNYEGVFASKALPLKITLAEYNGQLTAQATGQKAFVLTPFSSTEFRFAPAGLNIKFEQSNNKVDYSTFHLKQGGANYKFTRQ